MKCPACGLVNPSGSERCECGHDFPRHSGRGRRIFQAFLRSLWFIWLILTACDLVSFTLAGQVSSYFYAVFNLFTPIMFFNLVAAKAPLVVVPLLLAGLWAGDFLGKRIRWSFLRTLYHLLVLFGLTVAIDEINWGRPESINMFVRTFTGR